MLVDARSVPIGTVIETEVCIVGGGAAGITLAREFINCGFRVVLLESGGEKPEQSTQELYDGKDIGRPYDMFSISRLRYFGGVRLCHNKLRRQAESFARGIKNCVTWGTSCAPMPAQTPTRPSENLPV